jgi:hypothetical protein
MLRRRAQVQQIWYESNRTEALANPLWLRLFNVLALAFVVLVISGPLWLIPWPEHMLPGPLRTVRLLAGIIGLHVGLLLFPCVYFLSRILMGQRRWPERIKLLALIVGCAWLAWGNLFELLGFWRGVYDWCRYETPLW